MINWIIKMLRKEKAKYKFGKVANTIKDKPDERDYAFLTSGAPLPDKYEIPFMPPIRSQGSVGSCFIKETPILMEDLTYKRIDDINIGEYVYTHTGKPQKVINIFSRNNQANMISIQPFGIYEPIICTKEHPFLTQRGWVEAKNLYTSDYIQIPKIKDSYDKTRYNIEKDPEFLWLLGIYLAEASVYIKGYYNIVSFSLHRDETNIQERISSICTKYGIKTNVSYSKCSKGMRVSFSNKFMLNLLIELGGRYSDKKRIHNRLMFLEPKLQYQIFQGWYDGDGCKKFVKGRHTGSTVSLELAQQIQRILYRNNIFATIVKSWHKKDRKQPYQISFVEQKIKNNYRWYQDNNNFFVRVWKKQDFKLNENNKQLHCKVVYNLEIEEDHSYLPYGLSAHNCCSHALIACYEIQLLKKGIRKFLEGSELFHYYNARIYNGTYPSTGGMSIRDGCKILSDYGMGAEYLWPYNLDKVNEKPSQTTYIFAHIYKPKEYRRLYTLEDIKENIMNDIPVVCGIFLDDSFFKLNKTNYLYKPVKDNRGGHAITLVGFNNETQTFKARNSWSETWGNRGYFEIGYNDLMSHGFDFWVLNI